MSQLFIGTDIKVDVKGFLAGVRGMDVRFGQSGNDLHVMLSFNEGRSLRDQLNALSCLWISLKDKQPDVGVPVLVIRYGGLRASEAWRPSHRPEMFTNSIGDLFSSETIECWMPLPEVRRG